MKKLKLFFLITNILLILNTKTENSDAEDLDNEITFVQCPFSDMTKAEILEKVDHTDDLFYRKICLELADVINNKELTEAEKLNKSESILTRASKWTYSEIRFSDMLDHKYKPTEPLKGFKLDEFLFFLNKYKSDSDSDSIENFKKLYNKISKNFYKDRMKDAFEFYF